MKDKIAEDIDQIDMSELKLPSFAIYKNPTDYPGKSVARLFEGEHQIRSTLRQDPQWRMQR